jgi:RNA polymerase sigma-70 factor (ECF subfamily)
MLTLEPCAATSTDVWCAPSCARLCTKDGFADAYAALVGELTGYCRKALADHGLAEEITQEVFLRAWRHCSDFRAEFRTRADVTPDRAAGLRSWLFAIARNAVIDAMRGRGRRPALHPEPDQAVRLADPSDTFARYDTAEQVHRGLAGLTADQRAILTAIFIEELTYEQAAARLGIPVGTAKSRAYYALRALRAQFDGGPPRERTTMR